jgi:prolyl oligopeptidase
MILFFDRGASMKSLFAACAFVVAIPGNSSVYAQQPSYPTTKTVHVVDDFHGIAVSDPYRWMEDENDPDLKIWIDAQNTLTSSYLDAYAGKESIKSRLTELWNYPRYTVPFRR